MNQNCLYWIKTATVETILNKNWNTTQNYLGLGGSTNSSSSSYWVVGHTVVFLLIYSFWTVVNQNIKTNESKRIKWINIELMNQCSDEPNTNKWIKTATCISNHFRIQTSRSNCNLGWINIGSYWIQNHI